MEVTYLEVVLFLYGVFMTTLWVTVSRKFNEQRRGMMLFMSALAEDKVQVYRKPDGSTAITTKQ